MSVAEPPTRRRAPKPKGAKKSRRGGGDGGGAGDVSLRAHPRAVRGIRRARFGGGLLVAVLAGLLAHRAGVPAQDVLLRALLAGVLGHLIAWGAAILAYRAIAQAEIQRALQVRRERLQALRDVQPEDSY